MNKDLISIIIPVFNSEKYLEDCLKSAASQTYINIEIIVVDDGSSDKSYTIYNKYVKRDKRVKIIRKENGGLSEARNFGIKKALGKYIFFLDSDDIIQNNAIEVLHTVIKQQEENAITFCTFERFKNTTKYDTFNNKIKKYSSKEYFESILDIKNQTYACGVLIPKALIKNDFFIKNRYYEDMASMYKIYEKCRKIIKIECKLYKYRMTPNSIVHTTNKKKAIDYNTSASEMIRFIQKKYDINNEKINTFMCYVNRECYILSKDIRYLQIANNLLKEADIKSISIKNRIKLLLLKNIFISKLLIKLKN